MNRVVARATDAINDIDDGATIMLGGFGLCGIPRNLIFALRDRGTKNLTVISNNAGMDGVGIGLLLENNQVRKIIGTYVGENKLAGHGHGMELSRMHDNRNPGSCAVWNT